MFYTVPVTVAAELPFHTTVSLEDNWSSSRPFRLVLPRAKRDRLTALVASLRVRRRCTTAGCTHEVMPVVLVETETEALLCPVHQLVLLDGSPIQGQPMLATAAW
jgi:hypothetical protein